MRNAAFLVAILLSSAAFAADTTTTASPAALPEYKIGVDDLLDIAVWNVAELQKTVPVRPDGNVSLPLVNDVLAAGLTPMELRDQLTKKLALFIKNPDVSVVVREIRSLKVSVIGQVRAPGRYDIKSPSTVLDAIALAGGLTEFAGRRNITVLRSSQRFNFDYEAAVNSRANSNFSIKAGDIVVVP